MNKAQRVYLASEEMGHSWLSPDYQILEAKLDDLTAMDKLYQTIRKTGGAERYFSDYAGAVDFISSEKYCDRKYVIKDSKGNVLAYLGLDTKGTVVRNFIHCPLTEKYDPLMTLLIKQWLYDHPDYEKVYYTMRYGWKKNPPLDKTLGIINLGESKPGHTTYYMRTAAGGSQAYTKPVSKEVTNEPVEELQ